MFDNAEGRGIIMGKSYDEKENENMIHVGFRLEPDVLEKIQQMAGPIPVSKIWRALARGFVEGDIEIEWKGNEGKIKHGGKGK